MKTLTPEELNADINRLRGEQLDAVKRLAERHRAEQVEIGQHAYVALTGQLAAVACVAQSFADVQLKHVIGTLRMVWQAEHRRRQAAAQSNAAAREEAAAATGAPTPAPSPPPGDETT